MATPLVPGELLLDVWSPLSHKDPLRRERSTNGLAPSWVGDHARRLTTYKVLQAYRDNVARLVLRPSVEIPGGDLSTAEKIVLARDPRDEHREYGDAELLVERAVDVLLGQEPQIVVDGAGEPPEAPDLPPEPAALEEGVTGPARRLAEAMRARWEADADRAIDDWMTALELHPVAREREKWLRQWADDEGFLAKIVEAEGDAVCLGDAVYALAWSSEAGRPVVTVYDPGFYFPVLETTRRDYPTRVHVAWEEDDSEKHRWVHRITWELGPIMPAMDADGFPRFENDRLVLLEGDTQREDGTIVRRYPWQTAEEDPSSVTCYLSEARWRLGDTGAIGLDDFSAANAQYLLNEDGEPLRRLDLRIDFLPVIHIPNTPASKEHFGRSLIGRVSQLLDDIQAADTDRAKASSTTGVPPIHLAGAVANGAVSVKPGQLFTTSENGKMTVLDTSAGLTALGELADGLRDLLSVNSQLSAETLGRVKASEVPSGLALIVAMATTVGLTRKMRLVRTRKYPLLHGQVQKLAMAGGALPPGPVLRAELAFGSVLPSDVAAVVERVVKLLQEHGISRATALRWLTDAGLDVGDLSEELDRIQHEDFEGARDLADAVNAEAPAAEYLGVELPEPPPAPPIVPVPPGPPGPPAPPAPPA